MNRGRRELLAAVGGALIIVGMTLPWAFLRFWLGGGGLSDFGPGSAVSGFDIVGRWPFALGALMVLSSFLEFRRGISMTWTIFGLGAIGLWQFGTVCLQCFQNALFSGFEPTTCTLSAGLFMVVLGSVAALVAGALGLRAQDRAPTSWPDLIRRAGHRSAKAVVDFHEHRHDF